MSVPAIARSKQLAGTDLARISSLIVAGPTGPTGPAGPTAVSSVTSADGSLAVAGSASVSLNLNPSHSNAWGALQSFTGMNLAQRTGGPAADLLSFFACETFAFAWQGPWANHSAQQTGMISRNGNIVSCTLPPAADIYTHDAAMSVTGYGLPTYYRPDSLFGSSVALPASTILHNSPQASPGMVTVDSVSGAIRVYAGWDQALFTGSAGELTGLGLDDVVLRYETTNGQS